MYKSQTVLKGYTLEQKKVYFEARGSHSAAAWDNRAALEDWISVLEETNFEHARPLDWVRKMTDEDPKARPDATTLYQDFAATTGDDEHMYCGLCCSDAMSSDCTSWHGSDVDEDVSGRPESVTMNTTASGSRSGVSSPILDRTRSNDSTPVPIRKLAPEIPRRPVPPIPTRCPSPRADHDLQLRPATVAETRPQTSLRDFEGLTLVEHDRPDPSAEAKQDRQAPVVSQSPLGDIELVTEPEDMLKPTKSIAEPVFDEGHVTLAKTNPTIPRQEPHVALKEDIDAVKVFDQGAVRESGVMLSDGVSGQSEGKETLILEPDRGHLNHQPLLHAESTLAHHGMVDGLHGTAYDHYYDASIPENLRPVHVGRRPSALPALVNVPVEEKVESLVERLARLASKSPRDFEEALEEARKTDPTWRSAVLEAVSPSATVGPGVPTLHLVVRASDMGLCRDLLELYVLAGADVNQCNYASTSVIQYAAQEQRPMVVKYLLRFGADAEHQNLRKQTALHIACRTGNPGVISLLLRNQSTAAINYQDDRGRTALHLACMRGNAPAVQMLLTGGAASDIKDNRGFLPVDLCNSHNREDIQAVIETADRPTPLPGDELQTEPPPPYESLSRASDDQDTSCRCEPCMFMAIADLLVKSNGKGALDCPCFMCLELAASAMASDLDRMRKELEGGCDCRVCSKARTELREIIRAAECLCSDCKAKESAADKDPPLSEALYEGHDYWDNEISKAAPKPCDCETCISKQNSRAIQLLTEAGFSGKKSYRIEPDKAWHWLIDQCPVTESPQHVVRLLLEYGANINAFGGKGHTMLHAAVLNRNLPLAKFLLDKGARVHVERDSFWSSKAQYTPLNYAIDEGSSPMVRLLLREGADASRPIDALPYHTPLHQCAWTPGENLAAMLLAHNADMDVLDYNGYTPLMMAIKFGVNDFAKLLIQSGANLELSGKSRSKPLYYAISLNRAEIAGELVTYGADPHGSSTQHGALISAAQVGDGATIAALLKDSEVIKDINECDWNGRNAISLLADSSSIDILAVADQLVEAGIDVNAEDYGGSAPLHHAAKNGSAFLTSLLLSEGALEMVQNRKGQTPLDLAQSGRHKEVVELLGGQLKKKKKWYSRG